MIVEELALFFVSLFSNLCFERLLKQKIQQKIAPPFFTKKNAVFEPLPK